MITNLKINHLSFTNGTQIFTNEDFNITSDICKIEQNVVLRDYWYQEDGCVIAPKTILFQGSFSSGKTLIYTLLKSVYDIVVFGTQRNKSLEFDIEISFYYSRNKFDYHIISKGFNISDSLLCNGEIVQKSEGDNIVLTANSCLPAYTWFKNLIFIPSVYDNYEEYTSQVLKYFYDRDLNNKLSLYRHRFQHQTDYIVKLENIMASESNLCSMNTFKSTDDILKTPYSSLNQSTKDLLAGMILVDYINQKENGVLIVDDIDFIAKTRFVTFVNDHFVTNIASTPVQLVAFSNEIRIDYEKRTLFATAHKIRLDNII